MKKIVLVVVSVLVAAIALIAGCMGAGKNASLKSAPASAETTDIQEPVPENPEVPEEPETPCPDGNCPDNPDCIYRIPAHGFEIIIRFPGYHNKNRGENRRRYYPFRHIKEIEEQEN